MRGNMLLIGILAAVICGPANAIGYKMERQLVSGGGGTISGGSYTLSLTVGQPAAGYIAGTSILHWVGFWSPDTPQPTVVSSLRQAKLLADGTYVSLAGKVATSAAGDFANFFYIEESGRSSGIRVAASPSTVSGLARGSVVNAIGVLQTLPSGERQIAGPMVIIASTAGPLTPLGMPGKSIGGANLGTPPNGQYGVTGGSGINTIGLLIRTWGRVTATGTGYVMVDDGSGSVMVDTSVLASQPPLNSYISVTGISSMYESSGSRYNLILPRAGTDVFP